MINVSVQFNNKNIHLLRKFYLRLSPAIIFLAVLSVCPSLFAADKQTSPNLVEQYCVDCHNFEDYSGGLSLEAFNPDAAFDDIEVGEKVIEKLRAGMMPPADKPRPDHEVLQSFAASIEKNIDKHFTFNPGRVGLHRLNRAEYGNAVRDLLGLHIHLQEFFPADDSSRGFDNQAGSLVLSPALLEAYLTAAAKISQLAVGTGLSPTQKLYRVLEDENQNFHIEGLPFGTRGGLKVTHNFPANGEYAFKIFAITLGNMGSHRPFGTVDGETLLLLIDGKVVRKFDWDKEFGRDNGFLGTGDLTKLPTLNASVQVSAGEHEVGVTFVATNFAPGLDMNNDFERSTIETGGIPGYTFYPHVGSVRIDGPNHGSVPEDTTSRRKIFICKPGVELSEKDCAQKIIMHLANLAYRGNVEEYDFQVLNEFFQEGRQDGGFDHGIELVVQRILSSPKFIYRSEGEPADVEIGEVFHISDLELASRLSFFLWSSIPDQELLDVVKSGKLRREKILKAQVRRMLWDEKSAAMTKNFAGQWLALRNLNAHVPLVDRFPDFDNLLRQSFRTETELFFDYLIRENRPVQELLTANYTFVNERLALHYGIPHVRGDRFRKVELSGALQVRRGILGKGSTLTVASQPGRTAPVIRGYWALSNILGVEPPPPPPDVPALQPKTGDAAGNEATPSMREQMEIHRTNPACEGCHKLMDPIGFALESFDAIGGYRIYDNGNPINTQVELYDGARAEGASDLVAFLLRYDQSYLRNITQRMLTYALGRGMNHEDMPMVRAVQRDAAAKGFGFQDLIVAVVTSDIFQHNRALGAEADNLATASAGGP